MSIVSSVQSTPVQPVTGSTLHCRGIDGRGVGVAVIDSGIDADRFEGHLVAGPDFTASAVRRDATGHGTHLGAIVGDRRVGIAPGAKVIDVRVAGDGGATDVNAVIAAIDWAVANRFVHGINIILLAFGADRLPVGTFDPLAAAVTRASAAGVLVVVAAGNQGPDAPMQTPACAVAALTVGAGERTGAGWEVCDFSTRSDGIVDLYAPGRSIVSARSRDVADASVPGEACVGSDLIKGSGSSQAAAVVAGAAALLLQVDPTLSPEAVRSVLAASAVCRDDDFAGVLDIDVAVVALEFRDVDRLQRVPTAPVWNGWAWGGLEWAGWAWGGWAWGGLEWAGWAWGGWAWGGLEWAGWAWGGWAWGGLEWAGWAWG